MPLKHLGCHTQVFNAAVGATADKRLVYFHVVHLAYRPGVCRGMRQRYLRLDGGYIILDYPGVFGIYIRLIDEIFSISSRLYIKLCLVVHVEQAGLAARLDSHIGHSEAAVHRKLIDSLAGKLHGRIKSAVDTDIADSVKDKVFASYPLAQRAVIDKLDGGRHLHPDITRSHGDSDIRRAHARGESTQGTIGAGMRIRPDDDVTGKDQALLRQKHMLDAHLADVVKFNPLLEAELAHLFSLLGGGYVFIRHEMVGHHDDFSRVKDLRDSEFIKFLDSDRRRNIIR